MLPVYLQTIVFKLTIKETRAPVHLNNRIRIPNLEYMYGEFRNNIIHVQHIICRNTRRKRATAKYFETITRNRLRLKNRRQAQYALSSVFADNTDISRDALAVFCR